MSLRKTPKLPTYNIADYAYFSYNAFGVFSKLSRNPVGSSKKPRVPRYPGWETLLKALPLILLDEILTFWIKPKKLQFLNC